MTIFYSNGDARNDASNAECMTNITLYLGNDTRQGHSYYGNRTQASNYLAVYTRIYISVSVLLELFES